MLKEGEHTLKKAAGVKRCVQKRLQHSRYRTALVKNSRLYRTQTRISSKKQRLFTVKQTRIALSALEIKRFVLPGGVKTLPHGHYKISEYI